jgi:hypothetical protein
VATENIWAKYLREWEIQDRARIAQEHHEQIEKQLGVKIFTWRSHTMDGIFVRCSSRFAENTIYEQEFFAAMYEQSPTEAVEYVHEHVGAMAQRVRDRERHHFHFRHANRPDLISQVLQGQSDATVA